MDFLYIDHIWNPFAVCIQQHTKEGKSKNGSGEACRIK
uniref:Uncharacterized protein n=1 Tax=Elizabethkingia anophelis TaxID=1117645 RepID=A0A455ZE17_9FLAO|nr:TPA_exp: hypothetical protein [Elizabethkingia anophelis]